MEHEHRTLTYEVAQFYASSLGDVFTPDGDAGVIDDMYEGIVVGDLFKVVGRHVEQWFGVDQLTYNHTDYLRVKAQREREGY